MIAGDRTQRNVKKSLTPVHTPSPSAIKSSPRRWGSGDFYERHWIPAFAGMTGWPTGRPTGWPTGWPRARARANQAGSGS